MTLRARYCLGASRISTTRPNVPVPVHTATALLYSYSPSHTHRGLYTQPQLCYTDLHTATALLYRPSHTHRGLYTQPQLCYTDLHTPTGVCTHSHSSVIQTFTHPQGYVHTATALLYSYRPSHTHRGLYTQPQLCYTDLHTPTGVCTHSHSSVIQLFTHPQGSVHTATDLHTPTRVCTHSYSPSHTHKGMYTQLQPFTHPQGSVHTATALHTPTTALHTLFKQQSVQFYSPSHIPQSGRSNTTFSLTEFYSAPSSNMPTVLTIHKFPVHTAHGKRCKAGPD